MKTNRLLALLLSICILFGCTGCSFFEAYFPVQPDLPDQDISGPSDPTDDNTKPENPDDNVTTKPDGGSGEVSFINVIMVNDNHGILSEPDGSLDKIASGISYYASLGDVVKIANGDMFQGTYVSSTLRGLPMLDALNALDFDAFVIGNHEFDWGFDEMKKYKDGDLSNGEADFPFLGANIIDKRTGERVDWLEPYTVVEVGGIRIGIIGIIGEVESSILASHVKDYDFVYPELMVKDLAVELRTEKDCDVVIVATHGDDDTLNFNLSQLEDECRIDGIFNGHSHVPTDEEITRNDGSTLCVLQNGGYGESFATLKLEFDEKGDLVDTDGTLNSTYRYSANGILSPVFEKYSEYMAIGETVLFTVDEYVSKYDVGIEVAHSMFVKYGTDFAVINRGGVRASIDAGEVTYAEAFQVLPFENEVYIVTLTGGQIKDFFDSASIYYWGLNSINDNQSYQMAIVDYLFLSSAFDEYRTEDYVDTNDLIRDVFIDYLS